ncbi:MAG: PPK2 family polyphosphate kinase [Verrucomicrobiales bacterium]
MKLQLDTTPFIYDGSAPLNLDDHPNELPLLYDGKKEFRKLLEELTEEIDEAQERMYAHDRYALLLVFQAMDAAGKDSTIRSVISGVNPHGVTVTPFKSPSSRELDHDFLWRTNAAMPERGRIGIFNRSYYEEVLIVRVHPEILSKYQRIPTEHLPDDLEKVWKRRYSAICDMEKHLFHNGTHTLKFFLNISKQEQARRFLRRIDKPSKNWKFSAGDVEERGYWDDYQKAYQKCIEETATPDSPWCIIPADDKMNMRLIVSTLIRDKICSLDTKYPKLTDSQREDLKSFRSKLEKEAR